MPDAQTVGGFRIYPRGFLGGAVGVPPKPIQRPYQEEIHRHQFHPGMFKPAKAPVEVNQNIEKMWVHFLKHNHAIYDFGFRETVLKVALGAFGTRDFKHWVGVQHVAATTGQLHIDFLEDTLNFIQYGKRTLAIAGWLPMLTLSDVGTNVTPMDEKVKKFFVEPETQRERNVDLVDALQRWCSQDGGFEDLIQTLHVLFGEIAA